MLFSKTVIVSFLAALVTAQSKACNANNCLRAVRAGAFPNRPTSADCAAYQTRTETVTRFFQTTTTVSASVAPVRRRGEGRGVARVEERAVSSRTMPSYASACSTSGAYASACSCIGITASTATSTLSVTETRTTTAVAAPTGCASGDFVIQASDSTFVAALDDFFYDPAKSRVLGSGSVTSIASAARFNFVTVQGVCRLTYPALPGSLSSDLYNGNIGPREGDVFRVATSDVFDGLTGNFGRNVISCQISATQMLACQYIDSSGSNVQFNGFTRGQYLRVTSSAGDSFLVIPAPV